MGVRARDSMTGLGRVCRQISSPGRRMSDGRGVMKEWAGNRCLRRMEGANGAGMKEWDALSASEAKQEDEDLSTSCPCSSGAGSLGSMGPMLHGSSLKK